MSSMWIEFHPDRLLELQKFQDFRAELRWNENQTLGFLARFWGKVLKLREDGDITGWRPDFIAHLTDVKGQPDALMRAMERRWIDVQHERVLVHDWLECAERYLEGRYRTADPLKLVAIWEKHGKVYELSPSQREIVAKRKSASSLSKGVPPDLTQPNRTKPKGDGVGIQARSNGVHRVDTLVNASGEPMPAAERAKLEETKRRDALEMPFGEYRGVKIGDLDPERADYLLHEWKKRQLFDLPEYSEVKAALEQRLAYRNA